MIPGGKFTEIENKKMDVVKAESPVDKTETAVDNKQTDSNKTQANDGSTQTDTDKDNTKTEDVKGATGSTEVSEDPQMVWLRKYFAKSLGICFEEPPERLLDEVTFEGIARYIASDKCKKVVVMTGAGISTSAGIPDFRSPGTGCYEQLKKEYNIENPQQLFEYSYFKDNPEPYYKYRKELWRCTYKPTPCHYFIRMLENKNKLLRHFTQNIDGLEVLAGLSKEKLIQAHGTMETAHCMQCGQSYSQQWVRDKIYGAEGPVPRCDMQDCGGLVRPDIVMFGESLPARFAEHLSDIDDCDFLLIMGTSLVVRPFSNLPIRTKDNVPRLFINLEKTKTSNHPISILFFGGGFDFDKEDNIRDVFWQGTCDDGCYALADLIGWGDELRTLVKEEHARLNKELGLPNETTASSKTNASTEKSVLAGPKKTSPSEPKKQETKQNSITRQQHSHSQKSVNNGTNISSQKSVNNRTNISSQKSVSREPVRSAVREKQKSVPGETQRSKTKPSTLSSTHAVLKKESGKK